MLDGNDAYRYARRRLGFVTYWRCRIVDAIQNKQTQWRILDTAISVAVVEAAYFFGTWWLAILVLVYGLWNYTDGMVRARW